MKQTATLRDRVLARLANSTEKHPVGIAQLRTLCDDDPDQLDELYRLLDELNADLVGQRKAGMKQGKQQLFYWIVKDAETSAPEQKPAPVVHRVAPSKPAEDKAPTEAVQAPTTPAAQQSKQDTVGRSLGTVNTCIFSFVSEHNGVRQYDIIEHVLRECPRSNERQIKKTLDNMYRNQKKLRREVSRGDYLFHINSASTNSTLVKSEPDANQPAEKSKQYSPIRAVRIPDRFDCLLSMHHTMILTRGTNYIHLDDEETRKLVEFCVQNAPAFGLTHLTE